MRYCVFSDVHGNIDAFSMFILESKKQCIDEYIFLGDLIGYSANPCECIDSMMGLKPSILISGNHESVIVGKFNADNFNPLAKTAINWTIKKLRKSDFQYLDTFIQSSTYKEMTFVHGSLNDPERFNYIFSSDDAFLSFEMIKTKICFIAHTHVPTVFLEKRAGVIQKPAIDFIVKEDEKYIVNVGSVGQPRDKDNRICYCIYDDEKNTIEFKRADYNIKNAQKKIIAAGLPIFLAYRLEVGR